MVLLGGPNLLDEEAAVKSAMRMLSLISGFTIWLSNGCACLLSSIAVISKMSLCGSSTSVLTSSSGGPGRLTLAFLHHLFNELLSAFLGLVQDGEGLVFANTSLPFFCCPK